MKIRRLRTQIVVYVSLLLLASGTFTALFVSANVTTRIMAFKQQRAERTARGLAGQLATAIDSGDWTTAALLVRAEAEHSNAYVWLSSGRRDMFATPGGTGTVPDALRKLGRSPAEIRLPEGNVLAVRARLPHDLGLVHVALPLSRLEATRSGIIRDVLISTVLALLIGIAGLAVLASFITRPVKTLREVTQRMGRGDLGVVAPVGGVDELADLAVTFNEMASQIRERIRHGEELHAYFERVLDHMPADVIVCDEHRKIEYANKSVRDRKGSLARRPCIEAFPEGGPCGHCPAVAVLGSGKVLRESRVTPAGRHVNMTVVPMTAAGSSPSVVTVVEDVTEIKSLEERLRRAERLAVVGEVAAGIVHAINNPLDGVRRALELARRSPENAERQATMLELASEGTDRIAEVTRRVLDFARVEETRTAIRVCANQIVKEAADLVMLRADEARVEVLQDLHDELPDVTVDPRALIDVVVNLLMNGIDASPAGGKVTVQTRNGGDWVEIVVSDRGEGISREIIGRIFEPFFTTKEVGRGTGLGLSTARRIIESHGGDLTVQSAPDRGASFKIRLPSQAAVASATAN